MVTNDKYFQKFAKMLHDPNNKNKKGEEIYELLEKWHEKTTGKRRCKDYASFRSWKSQYYKLNS